MFKLVILILSLIVASNVSNSLEFSDLSNKILSGEFSIENYKNALGKTNLTEIFQNEFANKNPEYLALYKPSDVRYDTLVLSLMLDIFSQQHPDSQYLNTFDQNELNSQSVSVLSEFIPNLISYSKHWSLNYQSMFDKFNAVVNGLISIFNKNSKIKNEAAIFLKQVKSILNEKTPEERKDFLNLMQHKDVDVINNLRIKFNSMVELSEKLFVLFQKDFLNLMQHKDVDVINNLRIKFNSMVELSEKLFVLFQKDVLSSNTEQNVLISQLKSDVSSEMLSLLTRISVLNSQIWDSFVNYGFWLITDMVSAPSKL